MNRICIACTLALLALVAMPVQAADVAVTLDLDLTNNSDASGGGTWTLWGRIDDPTNGVDGTIGLGAVRALIAGIDFGTLGDAVTIAPGLGAIDPVTTDSGDRPPVLDLGGTIDIIYGQDISAAQVTGVGVNPAVGGALTDTLIASGTYSGAAPTFTTAGSESTDANLLTASVSPFAAAGADNVSTLVVTLGDVTGEGIVTLADIQPFVDSLTAPGVTFASDINQSGLVTLADIQPFVDLLSGASSAASSVPEPSSAMLLLLGGLALRGRRRRS